MSTEIGAIQVNGHLVLRPDTGKQILTENNNFDSVSVKTKAGFSGAFARNKHVTKFTPDATVVTQQVTDAVPVGGAVVVSALVVGKKDSGADVSAYVLEAAYSRNGSGNLTLINAVTQRVLGETTGTTDVTLAADTTNQWVNASITGVAASNYVWSIKSDFVIVDGTQTA